jgi:MerR family transcriptional regulator, mercuric resistance operon regulatory protein
MYRIGELSHITGVSREAIRYYERLGVLPVPRRAANGYRAYTDEDVERLRFVARTRRLDFTLDDIAQILSFRDQAIPPCDYVLNLIANKIVEVQARIRELEQLQAELRTLDAIGKAGAFSAKSRAVCQILEAAPEDIERKISAVS